jgi:uncharacterized membrane protein
MQNMSGKSTFGLDANLVALLCYVNICLPIGLVVSIATVATEKNNKLTRFHAFQSLFLLAFAIVLVIVYWVGAIIGVIIDGIIGLPIFTLIVALISIVLFLGLLIGIIIAAVKGYQGQIFKLPLLGGFADKFSG